MEQFPWDRHPSIYEHLQAHSTAERRSLADGGENLPDEDRVNAGSQLRWAAGAKDGVFVHHMGGDGTDEANDLLNLVRAYWETPTVANKAQVYDFLVPKSVVSLIDPFLKALIDLDDVNHARLHDLAYSLATESSDREPVKFGVAVLGLYRQEENRDIFRTLGRHDEFTLFCAVALGNDEDAAEEELWALGKEVHGWGRVHVVERLAKTDAPEIKDWLLRQGYQNSIMHEYLAYPCAVGGGLLSALDREVVDDDLLRAAGEIIQALIRGGPAANLDDYEDGAAVVKLFLDQIEQRGSSLPQLLAVVAIRDFLDDEEADWDARACQGWTQDKRQAMRKQCATIIERPTWRERVLTGLKSEDEQEFAHAAQGASVLGIDAWPYHWDRLQKQPRESGRWFHVMRGCTKSRINDVVALAEASIPLDKVATGPGTELGLGLEYEAHHCLDYLLQDLGRFPGEGVRLIATGLQSPVTRNRNMALRALSEWGQDEWPASVPALLKQARDCEPESEVRERIENVLAGRPLEEGIEAGEASGE